MSLNLGRQAFFVFDAGTGIRLLSNFLLKVFPEVSGRIFLSHPHWDHINAIPFFEPIYNPENRFEILGPANGGKSVKELISHLMDGICFPVGIRELEGVSRFTEIREENMLFDGVEVSAIKLRHPGTCLGYRVRFNGRSISYITDNEIFPPDSLHFDPVYEKNLTEFVYGSHVLITDCTYTDAAYVSKSGRGHSCVSQVARLAAGARVKCLVLFHHDPEDTDDDVDAKVKQACLFFSEAGLPVKCLAAKEGMVLRV